MHHGYGRHSNQFAHIYGWRTIYGRELPEGYHLHHTCGVRHCVNPRHLKMLTVAEHAAVHLLLRPNCKYGHPIDGMLAKGQRYCRTCSRLATAKRRQLAKQAWFAQQ